MECSPTFAQNVNLKFLFVAVPVNYGMLSYRHQSQFGKRQTSQSPSIMECSPTGDSWNFCFCLPSQSPSIMECSPTRLRRAKSNFINVAVPVNYGMLSYQRFKSQGRSDTSSQSPSIMECSPTIIGQLHADLSMSQSPSIMECSPT